MNLLGASILGSFPWLLAAALCFALAAATRPRRRDAAGLIALTVATFCGRLLLTPARFFHQNGQGPLWVERALHGVFREYGPGLMELFHGAAALRPRDPEGAVFLVQSLLAAPGPACGWLIARRVGADRALAGALALALALDPMLARLARSESYFGTGAALLLLAAGALSLRATRAPVTSAPFVCASLAAGALVAQVARLHPLLWPAAALTPLVLLVGDGVWRRRVRAAAAASGLIAMVVALVAGPSMWAALHSDLAARFSPNGEWGTALRLAERLPPFVPVVVVAVALARRRFAAGSRALLVLPVVAVIVAADFPAASRLPAWVEGGYLRLYAAALVVLCAALLRDVARTGWHSYAVALGGAALLLGPVAARFPRDRVVPTDALEQDLARSWRRLIPARAAIVWLGQTDPCTLRLPLYPDADPELREVRPGDARRLRPSLSVHRNARTYYYRSSLCSTAVGAAACDDVERRGGLTLLRAWTLPAVESYSVPYSTAAVRVALYRVDGDAARWLE
jgi:hypothetical protein